MNTITAADEITIAHVCKNMRDLDREEIFCLRDHEDPMAYARELAHTHFAWCVSHENRPAGILAVDEVMPRLWNLHFITTEQFPKTVLTFTHFVKRGIIPWLFENDAYRAQVYVLAKYAGARGLLRLLGAKEVAELPQLGKNGEDFVICEWNRKDVASWVEPLKTTPQNVPGRQKKSVRPK